MVLWFATQAQRDHNVIHAGNFRVQPQAIMGSGIVEYVVRPLSVVEEDVGGCRWYCLPIVKS